MDATVARLLGPASTTYARAAGDGLDDMVARLKAQLDAIEKAHRDAGAPSPAAVKAAEQAIQGLLREFASADPEAA